MPVLALQPVTETQLRVTGSAADFGAELHLVAEVVVDHPLPPQFAGSVKIEGEAFPPAGLGWNAGSRRRIKGHPAELGEIDFHPGMRIFLANNVIAGKVVVLAAAESIHHARGNTQRAQHHRHGRSKVLAMSLPPLKKEISQRVPL